MPTPQEIGQVLAALAETPRRITSLTRGFEPDQLHAKPSPEVWSANEILAHLRSCADVWGKSILAMLAQESPRLRYVSPRTWIRKTDYPKQEFHSSFRAFSKQRIDLLEVLKPLSPDGWARRAIFTGTTKGKEHTVFTYAQRLAEHEVLHLGQIERVLNRNRRQ
jgi:hypothetical protein